MRVRSLHSVRRCWSGDKGLVRCCRPKNPSAQQDRRETFMEDFQSWSNRTIGGDTLATGEGWSPLEALLRRIGRTARRLKTENPSAITSLIFQALAFHRLCQESPATSVRNRGATKRSQGGKMAAAAFVWRYSSGLRQSHGNK